MAEQPYPTLPDAIGGEAPPFRWCIGRNGNFDTPLAYIQVPKDHPWDGKNYDDVPLDVHGGPTYGRRDADGLQWFGWDYSHYGDWVNYRIGGPMEGKRWSPEEVRAHVDGAIAQARIAAVVVEEVTPYPLTAPLQVEWCTRVQQAFKDLMLPGYMLPGMMDYIVLGLMPGEFLTALFCNDLRSACSTADDANAEAIHRWGRFLNLIPSDCFGSRPLVTAWCEHQGLKYQPREKK